MVTKKVIYRSPGGPVEVTSSSFHSLYLSDGNWVTNDAYLLAQGSPGFYGYTQAEADAKARRATEEETRRDFEDEVRYQEARFLRRALDSLRQGATRSEIGVLLATRAGWTETDIFNLAEELS